MNQYALLFCVLISCLIIKSRRNTFRALSNLGKCIERSQPRNTTLSSLGEWIRIYFSEAGTALNADLAKLAVERASIVNQIRNNTYVPKEEIQLLTKRCFDGAVSIIEEYVRHGHDENAISVQKALLF